MNKARFNTLLAHVLNKKREGYGTGRRRLRKMISYTKDDGFLSSLMFLRMFTNITSDSAAIRFAVQIAEEIAVQGKTPNGEIEG